MSGNFMYRHHVEPRVKLYSPTEESFPIPLKYIDVSRTTHTNLDVKQERRIDDYWNIDGSRDLSDSWKGFTQFTQISEKPPDGYMWFGERLTKRQATSRPDHLRSSRKSLKMQEENWKRQWLQLCFARFARNASMVKPVARLMISSLNLRVSWKPVNPQECVWKNLYQNIMRTISREKVTIHYSITIWYTNLFLCRKQWRYPQQKQQWMKNGRSLKRFRRGKEQKSETNLKWLMKQEKKKEKYTSPHWWTSVTWRMRRQNTKNTKVESYSEATLWNMILDLVQYSQNRGSSASQMTAAKGHGYHIHTARLRMDKQLTQYLLIPRSKWKMLTKFIENSQVGMSRHLDSSTTTQMAKIMVRYGRPSRSSWAKSVRSSFGRTVMGKAIWENPIEVRLGESLYLGMLIRTAWKMIILICVCGWHQIGWKETKHWSDAGKYSMKKLIWENQHLSWIMCTWDVLKDILKWAKMLLTITEPCLNPEFPLEQRKITMLGKSEYLFVVLWHGKSRQEMCGTILWLSKQDDSATPQSINSMPWWPSLQRRRIEICRRIVKSVLSIVLKC